MGCTHYPLLAETIGGVMGNHVTLIDPGRVTAGFVKDYLEQNGLLCTGKADGQYQFFVSDCPDDFAELGSKFLQQEIPGGVEKIDIEKYM